MNEINPPPPHLNEYEFKGKKLQPFSKGRLSMALAAGVRVTSNPPPGIKDILGTIFLCLCDVQTRSLAQMNPALFWEKEEEWENENVEPADFEAASNLFVALINDVTKTKAEPLDNADLSQLPDPFPNSPSPTI